MTAYAVNRLPNEQHQFMNSLAFKRPSCWFGGIKLNLFLHVGYGCTYGQSDLTLTVARPVETPPRLGFYILPSHNQNGHVVSAEALASATMLSNYSLVPSEVHARVASCQQGD